MHLAPIDELDGSEEWQHEPRVAEVKRTLEQRFRSWLGGDEPVMAPVDVTDVFRAIAHEALVPAVYEWLADEADRSDLVEFLAYEGGPDADFDDLVALCQVGLSGLPKLTLAANYWDEMGRGDPRRGAHRAAPPDGRRAAHAPDPVGAPARRSARAQGAERLPGHQPGSPARDARQPRSARVPGGSAVRRVVAAMDRLGMPPAARPFYAEHATADPRHGKDWIDGAIAPIVQQHPAWGPRILRGARGAPV